MSYRNSDLEFLCEPRVQDARGVPGHEGEHYVAGVALPKTGVPNDFYLHSDGRWHCSAFGAGSTGYFSSIAEAEHALVSMLPSLKRHSTFEADLNRMEAVQRFEAGLYESA